MSESDLRTSTVFVYVTAAERDKLEAWAAELGLSISTAIRAVMLPLISVTGPIFRSSETEVQPEYLPTDPQPVLSRDLSSSVGWSTHPDYVTELDGTDISGRGQTR